MRTCDENMQACRMSMLCVIVIGGMCLHAYM